MNRVAELTAEANATDDKTRKAAEFGLTFEGVKVDMGKLVEWKNGVVKRLTGGIGQLLKMAGVTVIQGTTSGVTTAAARSGSMIS